ncbi:MAG: hypothetical protein JWM64_525 [Frankiales bacterium]|nr:hypothetical protein [Frankiales bacterium]
MLPSRRLLLAALPLAVVVLAAPALAAPTAGLTVTPTKPSGAATTCLTLTVGAVDAAGAASTDTPTVTVSLAATGTATTSFCDPSSGASSGDASPTASRAVVLTRSSATGTASARIGVTSAAPGPVTVVASGEGVRSATATATFSDPPPPPCGPAPGLTVSTPAVVAGRPATATVTATPGTEVQLYAYSRPSTTYRLARQVLVPSSGTLALPFTPPGSTRLYAVQRYCTDLSPSAVVGVSSPVSLAVRRLGPLRYRFSGSTGSAPSGTPVLLLRRTPRGEVLLARTSTGAGGRWTLDRTFLSPGALDLVARTAATPSRLSGTSPVRPTAVA